MAATHVDVVAVARAARPERAKAEQRAKDALARKSTSIGVQVKDIDIGLLDFPCVVEGPRRAALLEKWVEILHHSLAQHGWRIRRPQSPIDERIARSKRTN